MDFTSELSETERSDCKLSLDAFVVQHAHHRPIVVVSSGGTVADLEINSVRCLDNFSTGLRGAIAVEEFLKRGYAVIHLWRTGSASPFARVLAQYLGLPANHCLTVQSLGRLFAIVGENVEDDLVQTVLQQERDAYNNNDMNQQVPASKMSNHDTMESSSPLTLNRGLQYSTTVQRALRERSSALQENRLLTIPFRSVEDYLGKLQLCALSVQDCQSLAMFFLAAAVSDFYIPKADRVQHKIQSSGGSEGLVLQLQPVPKTLGLLRSTWAPQAFVVSFKLETDATILRQKANRAVERYGCHLVIGNLLHTRHDQVWILSPENHQDMNPNTSLDWSMVSITRSGSIDTLESTILDFVVQSHFEYISWHYHHNNGTRSAQEATRRLQEKKKRVQRELFWKRATTVGMEIAGALLAVAISYSINTALQRRMQR